MDWNSIFSYKDGVLYWKVRSGTRGKPGSVAGHKKSNGYVEVSFKKTRYLVHGIVWEMHNGPIPKGKVIDHINHIRYDNRIENLRVVLCVENSQNMSQSSRNTSGRTGVHWRESRNYWEASIRVEGKLIFLGKFEEFEKAVDARVKAEVLYGFHTNHGKIGD